MRVLGLDLAQNVKSLVIYFKWGFIFKKFVTKVYYGIACTHPSQKSLHSSLAFTALRFFILGGVDYKVEPRFTHPNPRLHEQIHSSLIVLMFHSLLPAGNLFAKFCDM